MKKYISILAAAAVLMLSGCTSGSTSGSVVTEVSNASEVSETSAASQDAEGTSEGAPEAPQGAGTPLTAADILRRAGKQVVLVSVTDDLLVTGARPA